MAFCSNCGKQMDDNVKFCPACGTQNLAYQAPQSAPQESQPQQAAPQQAAPQQEQPQGTQQAGPQYSQPQGPAYQQQNQYQYYQGGPQQQYQGPQGQGAKPNFFQKLMNTPDTTSQYDPRDIADNKIMAVLAYLGILVLIPMFAAPKNSRYARFHVRQGFNLFLCDIAVSVISILLSFIKVTRYIWGIPYRTTPGIVVFISWLISIPVLILTIIGIINAVQGKAKELPVIGKYQIIK